MSHHEDDSHEHHGEHEHVHHDDRWQHDRHPVGCRCGCRPDPVVRLIESVIELVGDRCDCGCSDCRQHGGHGGCGHGDGHGGHGGHGHGDGGHGPGGRPTRHPGTNDGGLGDPLTPGDLHHPPGRGHWPGDRKDMQLPYLFMRANPGDTGTRPVVGPFWESPDVYILAGVHPAVAPAIPPQLGQTALAGADNTVYAHVWNLGHQAAREVIVEFYWCDPSLGFNPVGAHLIGSTVTWLGKRGEPDCHKVVKCPESWAASYLNGGHECLLVRVWDVCADPLTTPEWDASINRHLGQRNIHVVQAGTSPGGPVKLSVGQLFGQAATITVARHAPTTMPWLQLHGGVRGQFPGQAVGTGALTLAAPGQLGGTGPITATGDDAHVMFATGDAPPPPGQAHVYRVTAQQQGAVVGGYTVVLMG